MRFKIRLQHILKISTGIAIAAIFVWGKGGGSSYLTISAIKEYTRSYKQVYNFMSFYSCTRDYDERTTTG